jgi:hypothetical protein
LPERTFRIVDGRVEHLGTGACLEPTGGNGVALGNCASAERWDVSRAQWRTADGGCIAARSSSPPLAIESCSTDPGDDQLWKFEFPVETRVRIRARDGRCVRRPATWAASTLAELGACDDAYDLFDTSRGEISKDGRCLGTTLDFRVCNGWSSQRFAFFGTIESPAGALTVEPTSDSIDGTAFSVTPVQGAPTPTQILDFYF